jgi:hypothetical protein
MLREVTSAIGDGLLEHPVHPADATVEVFTTLDRIRAQLRPADRDTTT